MSQLNPFEMQDFLGEARERVTQQFKDKVVVDKYLQLMLQSRIEIQEVLRDLMQQRSIDTAVGVNLDIIGKIVGQDRALLSVDVLEYFGFKGKVNAGSFGTLADPTVGAMFYSLNTPKAGNILLTDDVYRLFIKAKIFKNSSRCTPEEFIESIRMIFSVDKVQLTEGGANVTVLVGRDLSAMEVALLDYVSNSNGYPSRLIPKPIGVGVKWGHFDGENFFGFRGVSGARGFGRLKQIADYGVNYGNEYGLSLNELVEGSGGRFASLYERN